MDFISENDDFSRYPFLIAPAYQMVDKALVKKLSDYTEKGGHLILTCRTGQKDKNGHFFESPWAGPIRPLIGADLEFFDMLLAENYGTVRYNGSDYLWNTWAEILSPYPGTSVLASYTDQFYEGKASVIKRQLGNGDITYIGVASKDGLLERQIVRSVYGNSGVMIEDLPVGVFTEWRDGFYIAVNYTDNEYKFSIPPEARILSGSNPLKPANALIWTTGHKRSE